MEKPDDCDQMSVNSTELDSLFWEGAKHGVLLITRCSVCQSLCHPPLPMCPSCQSINNWEAAEMSGRGVVHTWIVSKHPSELDPPSRIVVLVQLDEGPRVVSNLRDVDDGDVRNEMEVQVFFEEVDGVVVPQFRPAPRV
jgi:uncharacterized OB-fold protein